jgi:hypothetical protein
MSLIEGDIIGAHNFSFTQLESLKRSESSGKSRKPILVVYVNIPDNMNPERAREKMNLIYFQIESISGLSDDYYIIMIPTEGETKLEIISEIKGGISESPNKETNRIE